MCQKKIKNVKHNIKKIAYYNLYFNGAAAIEQPGYRGVTHIVQHCMCEKIKQFEKELQKYAIEWNAVTSSSYMKFYMQGLSKYVRKYIDKFTKTILEYQITPEVFERERNIILIEYKEHFSDKYGTYVTNYFRKYFNMYCAIGAIEDIENITYEKFIQFKNKYYSKPSQIVFLHPYNEAELVQVSSCKEFNDISVDHFTYEYKEQQGFEYETYGEFKNQEIIAFDSGILSSKDQPECIVSLLYIMDILTSGLSSPMYSILRQKYECIYGLNSHIERLNEDQCMLMFYLFTPTNKADLALEKFKQIIKNMKKYLTKKQFNHSKIALSNYVKKRIATTVFNIIDGTNNEYKERIKNIMLKKTLTYDQFMKYVNTILQNNYHFYNSICQEV